MHLKTPPAPVRAAHVKGQRFAVEPRYKCWWSMKDEASEPEPRCGKQRIKKLRFKVCRGAPSSLSGYMQNGRTTLGISNESTSHIVASEGTGIRIHA